MCLAKRDVYVPAWSRTAPAVPVWTCDCAAPCGPVCTAFCFLWFCFRMYGVVKRVCAGSLHHTSDGRTRGGKKSCANPFQSGAGAPCHAATTPGVAPPQTACHTRASHTLVLVPPSSPPQKKIGLGHPSLLGRHAVHGGEDEVELGHVDLDALPARVAGNECIVAVHRGEDGEGGREPDAQRTQARVPAVGGPRQREIGQKKKKKNRRTSQYAVANA